MKKLIMASLLSLVTAVSAQADVITQWNFNSNPPDTSLTTGTIAPSVGLGTASLVGGTSATFASGNANGGSTDTAGADNTGWNVTTFAAQGTGDLTRGVQFLASTVGFQDVIISWDQRHSNTASRWVQFQYTTDGTNFTSFGSPFEGTAGDTWFNNRSVDLTGVSGVNDNANFGFRIVASFAPATSAYAPSNSSSTYNTTGTWRFDMVTVSATAVPEPTSMALLGVVGLGGWVARRFRKKQKSSSETVAA